MTVLVGGVGELYQGDLDLGRVAAERLGQEDLGPGVLVEDLHYGAIAVSQRLDEVLPTALILVGATARGGAPGSVQRQRILPSPPPVERFRRAVEEAGTGFVSIDLILEVASGFGSLPSRTVTIAVEPATTEVSDELSEAAEEGLEEALALVRAEVRRIPLLELVDRIHRLIDGDRLEPTPALSVMRSLVAELEGLDREGRWGRAFGLRDQLRLSIAAGETGEGMDHLDWSQWWGLIEELDRLQAVEVSSP